MTGGSGSGLVSPVPLLLQSEQIRVEVDPARGAKITSLRHHGSQREWLLQDKRPNLPGPSYGSLFTEAAMAGWDEMLPTVDACSYPCEPFAGAALPDHGEVWSQPWEIEEVSPQSIVCSIRGRALPYRLRRELEVNGSTLSARYSLSVEAPQAVGLLWAAHPQFVVEAGTLLTLPAQVKELSVAIEGTTGPKTQLSIPAEGLDCTRIVPKGTGMMLYARPEVTTACARITNPDGSWLDMDWDTDNVPYFAIWMDNGKYAASPVVCPEPMTGYYDNLRSACESDRLLFVETESPAHWALRVTLGTS